MTKIFDFELPDFDDYNVLTESSENGKELISHQIYLLKEEIVAEAFIYFNKLDQEPLRWPHRFILIDHTNKTSMSETIE